MQAKYNGVMNCKNTIAKTKKKRTGVWVLIYYRSLLENSLSLFGKQ